VRVGGRERSRAQLARAARAHHEVYERSEGHGLGLGAMHVGRVHAVVVLVRVRAFGAHGRVAS
jgi:hypothetical protein